MYGIADAQAACASGVDWGTCFDMRLAEALTIPGDRIAFSTYPIAWMYHGTYNFSYPRDTYARVQAATARRIWIGETGFAAVQIRDTYPHGGVGSCGTVLFPDTFVNDTEQANYVSWLLAEAQTRNMEAVVYWLARDYLDRPIAATCPCSRASDTCVLTDAFFTSGGATGELLMRLFGNMALRNYDGSPRPAHAIWRDYVTRPLSP